MTLTKTIIMVKKATEDGDILPSHEMILDCATSYDDLKSYEGRIPLNFTNERVMGGE